MKYSIHLNVYDGPLDLLCDMISKQKIDIKDISIIEITKQYLAYINMLEAMDLEVTSDFITMATKLLEIKSKYLLFSQRELDEEEDPRLELMEQLKEYKKYKKASEVLHRYLLAKKYFNWQDDPIIDLLILKQIIIYNFNKVEAKRKIVVINQIDVLKDFSLLYSLKNQLPYEIYFLSVKKDLFY